MATFKSQVDNITTYKTNIKSAIEAMGQAVTTLPTYAQAIRNISKDADAEVGDIFYGKTAYVNGQKITGQLQLQDLLTDTVLKQDIVKSGTSYIFHGYNGTAARGVYVRAVSGSIPFNVSVAEDVLADTFNITADKIKEGVTILGVAGSVHEGADTSDATATAADIPQGLTAYVSEGKVTGSLPWHSSIDVSSMSYPAVAYDDTQKMKIKTGLNISRNGYLLRNLSQNITMSIIAPYSGIATALNLQASQIAEGQTVLGIVGTYRGTDTSDATATANAILENETAYVNGTKITGVIPTRDIIADSVGQADITYTNNNLYLHGYSNYPNGVYLNPASGQIKFNITCSDSTILAYLGLTPDKIKKGVRVLNIVGTYEGETS